ncbi:HNH endonuclease [Saccharopolyspora mangrovi]|uniref:HNH endonuclease n=1 Tax=Saccharopolyspora mangrovi TaxID=3082379 RepID=A0ABU6A7D2_9PSEU|nr:HNH endonuclease [Saccharopolyspora sp. S2-29]MEB3367400.1 HNH endonuclease [Saccharopolyspora sp. S2-29]
MLTTTFTYCAQERGTSCGIGNVRSVHVAEKRRDTNLARKLRLKIRGQRDPCWLCGRDIDYELEFPHPHSFTVDHIVPVSKGGAEYDPENLRAAHYRCNQRKGDRLVPVRPTRIEFDTSRKW